MAANPGAYIIPDPGVVTMLRQYRESGRKTFLVRAHHPEREGGREGEVASWLLGQLLLCIRHQTVDIVGLPASCP